MICYAIKPEPGTSVRDDDATVWENCRDVDGCRQPCHFNRIIPILGHEQRPIHATGHERMSAHGERHRRDRGIVMDGAHDPAIG
jgi:hypothetical protein